jgi:parallel beta-helix repeat protein
MQSDLSLKLAYSKIAYKLEGEYKVPEGRSLEIEAGVTVLCPPGSQITISGVLRISGTEKLPVVFKAAQRGQGPWNGIHLEATKESVFEYVNISDAIVGIAMSKSAPNIRYCTLAWNDTGMRVGDYGAGSSPNVDKCIISFNKGDGVSIAGSSFTITGCTITKNGGWGINGEYYAGPRVSKSIIVLNKGGGVTCRYYECGVVIDGSIISDNGGPGIKNDSTKEWDLRRNYWGRDATRALQAGNGVAKLSNITGKVRMDEFLKSPPNGCGADKKALGRQKLW